MLRNLGKIRKYNQFMLYPANLLIEEKYYKKRYS